MDDLKQRIYKCFETVADRYNGEIIYPLKQSALVHEEFGMILASEFLDECYTEWLKNHNDNYPEVYENSKRAKGHWEYKDGILKWVVE